MDTLVDNHFSDFNCMISVRKKAGNKPSKMLGNVSKNIFISKELKHVTFEIALKQLWKMLMHIWRKVVLESTTCKKQKVGRRVKISFLPLLLRQLTKLPSAKGLEQAGISLVQYTDSSKLSSGLKSNTSQTKGEIWRLSYWEMNGWYELTETGLDFLLI